MKQKKLIVKSVKRSNIKLCGKKMELIEMETEPPLPAMYFLNSKYCKMIGKHKGKILVR